MDKVLRIIEHVKRIVTIIKQWAVAQLESLPGYFYNWATCYTVGMIVMVAFAIEDNYQVREIITLIGCTFAGILFIVSAGRVIELLQKSHAALNTLIEIEKFKLKRTRQRESYLDAQVGTKMSWELDQDNPPIAPPPITPPPITPPPITPPPITPPPITPWDADDITSWLEEPISDDSPNNRSDTE